MDYCVFGSTYCPPLSPAQVQHKSHEAIHRVPFTRLPPAIRVYLITSWSSAGCCIGSASSSALLIFFAFEVLYSSILNSVFCGLIIIQCFSSQWLLRGNTECCLRALMDFIMRAEATENWYPASWKTSTPCWFEWFVCFHQYKFCSGFHI